MNKKAKHVGIVTNSVQKYTFNISAFGGYCVNTNISFGSKPLRY
jgi:hypothetical protein